MDRNVGRTLAMVAAIACVGDTPARTDDPVERYRSPHQGVCRGGKVDRVKGTGWDTKAKRKKRLAGKKARRANRGKA